MFTFTTGAELDKQVSAESHNDLTESDIEYSKDIQNEVLKEVGYKLYKEGHSFGMEYEVLPNKNVEIVIKTADQKATEKLKAEMKNIALEVIMDTKYKPEMFKINIIDYGNTDTPKRRL